MTHVIDINISRAEIRKLSEQDFEAAYMSVSSRVRAASSLCSSNASKKKAARRARLALTGLGPEATTNMRAAIELLEKDEAELTEVQARYDQRFKEINDLWSIWFHIKTTKELSAAELEAQVDRKMELLREVVEIKHNHACRCHCH